MHCISRYYLNFETLKNIYIICDSDIYLPPVLFREYDMTRRKTKQRLVRRSGGPALALLAG